MLNNSINYISNIINEEINIFENLQQADKLYFNTQKLSQEDKQLILSITKGDYYTKPITDMYFFIKEKYNGKLQYMFNGKYKSLNELMNVLYDSLKSYNKNVFPIKNYFQILNNLNPTNNDIYYFIYTILIRNNIINLMKIIIPSIGIRNMKEDIRLERNYDEFSEYFRLLEYFSGQISLISNKEDSIKQKIYNKMFKSNTTLNDLIDFAEEKENLIGDYEHTIDSILELINEYSNDMTLLYNQNNIMVVRVESPEAIKAIGCNSLWCFTYGQGFDNAYRTWNNYSTNDIVYVIINFNLPQTDPEFMCVVIKPLVFKKSNDEEINDDKIYDLTNNPLYSPLEYLDSTIGLKTAKKILTFEYEDW